MFSFNVLRMGRLISNQVRFVIKRNEGVSGEFNKSFAMIQKDISRPLSAHWAKQKRKKQNVDIVAATEDEETDDNIEAESRPRLNFKRKMTGDFLDELYEAYPEINEYDKTEIGNYFFRMLRCGVKAQKALEILAIYPQVISVAEHRIHNTLAALRSVGLTETQRLAAIRRAPQLFELPGKKIGECSQFLKLYFSSAETLSVLSKSLEIFVMAEPILKKKLDYLIIGMSHETKNLANCKALSYSLKHIKTRHEFLIRAGLYKPIPYRKLIKILEKDKGKERTKYFKPLHLICYKDEDFLKVCTNNSLSLNELAAFEELYETELEVLEDEENVGKDGGSTNLDDDDDDYLYEVDNANAVCLIKSSNSVNFMNDAEERHCYF